jgi:hypothetical protein
MVLSGTRLRLRLWLRAGIPACGRGRGSGRKGKCSWAVASKSTKSGCDLRVLLVSWVLR